LRPTEPWEAKYLKRKEDPGQHLGINGEKRGGGNKKKKSQGRRPGRQRKWGRFKSREPGKKLKLKSRGGEKNQKNQDFRLLASWDWGRENFRGMDNKNEKKKKR